MCDGPKVICEIPDENVVTGDCGYNATTCIPPAACVAPNCISPCTVPENYPPCEGQPQPPCGAACCCSDSMCYQQPARMPSYKPATSYVRPCARMDTETVYKRSYMSVDPCEAQQSRMPPVRSPDTFNPFQGRMDNKTVQKLSYPGHCGVPPAEPVRPRHDAVGFCGPMAKITSQKHDFVPKPYSMRKPIYPPDGGIMKTNAPIDKCTINKLSYMPFDICKNPPPKPLLQGAHYDRPTCPGEKCTIQKLSYLPVCLPPKEDLPWAKQVRVQPPPCRPMCTTYKLSYLPNCQPERTSPVEPISAIKIFGNELPNKNTIYKLSYMCSNGKRPEPIMPRHGLCLPTAPMDKCTTYKLSYAPNCNVGKMQPVKPIEQTCRPTGPMQKITTQKHDFVPKPQSRRGLIIPVSSMCTPSVPMDRCTVNKLSYLPVDVCRFRPPTAIRPCNGLEIPKAPVNNCTTYKLSYLPVCTQPRQIPPWARHSSYVKPTAPIEKCTIQKLSYPPPGRFSCKSCSGSCKKAQDVYPRAGICN